MILISKYRFGFRYEFCYVCIVNLIHITMSQELIEFSELIDEQFEMTDITIEVYFDKLFSFFL
jgi:hypothetical protein